MHAAAEEGTLTMLPEDCIPRYAICTAPTMTDPKCMLMMTHKCLGSIHAEHAVFPTHPGCSLLCLCGRHGCLAARPLLLAPHQPEGEVRLCNPSPWLRQDWLLVPADSGPH